MIRPLAIALTGWIAFGTLVEARRDRRVHDDPVVVAIVEADLAARYCADLRSDVAAIRRVMAEHHMNHADAFTRKRSTGFSAHLDALRSDLARTPGEACARLWAEYGAAGARARLLRRA